MPRDFSVVGVAACRRAEQVNPQLTVAEIPAKEMSRVAVDLMMRRLTSPGSGLMMRRLTSPGSRPDTSC